MISAYHWVNGGRKGIHDILKERKLYPASQRMSAKEAVSLCNSDMGVGLVLNSAPSVMAEAFDYLVEQAISAFRKRPKRKVRSGFTCLDLIAGDTNRVFMSLVEFSREIMTNLKFEKLSEEERNRIANNGLEFDAEDLIFDLNARVRKTDLLVQYGGTFSAMDVDADEDVAAVAQNIMEGLLRVQDQNELVGMAALEYVSRPKHLSEVIVDGPVNTWLAKYVWVEGQKYFMDELSEIFPDLARILP